VDHRATPDDRVVVTDQEVHAHQLHPVLLGRDDLVFLGGFGVFVRVEHPRDVRSVDVAVEEPDAGAQLGESGGEVDRQSALADPAFPRGDGDDVLDPGQDLVFRVDAAVDRRRQVDLLVRLVQRLPDVSRDGALGGRIRRAKREVDVDAVFADIDLVDEVERDDVVSQIRVVDHAQALAYVRFVHGRGRTVPGEKDCDVVSARSRTGTLRAV
jgi:hypothetical protein